MWNNERGPRGGAPRGSWARSRETRRRLRLAEAKQAESRRAESRLAEAKEKSNFDEWLEKNKLPLEDKCQKELEKWAGKTNLKYYNLFFFFIIKIL